MTCPPLPLPIPEPGAFASPVRFAGPALPAARE